MKQVAKTQQVIDRLRASFGKDVDVSKLPVYECVALNQQPLRKASGLFKGAVATPRTLTDISSSLNAESAPMQIQHDTEALPIGRAFYSEVVDGESRVLFTCTDPTVQGNLDNGTIDQVSVGLMPASMNCSACGFDYLGASATIDNIWGLTCDQGHVLGQAGVHAVMDGVASFFELSLVGKGAAQGARIVGPSESRLQGNTQFMLAASSRSDGIAGVFLTATQKEPSVDLNEILGKLTAATTENATTKVELATATTALTAAQARVTELETALTAAQPDPELEAKAGQVDAATAALKAEAEVILTACSKTMDLAGKDCTALLSIIAEHRLLFAAGIPIGGVSKPAHQSEAPVVANAAGAFSTRR